MRPVDKGDGTAYTANIPINFSFGSYGQDKKNAYEYCVDHNFLIPVTPKSYDTSVANCLDFWLKVVKDNLQAKPVHLRTVADKNRLVVKGMIFDKITAVYKLAGVPMVQTIGGFCCYCDTPIPGLLEVEHRCPKSQYPVFSLDWENFLMSCGPCNNKKLDNPDRATVAGWTPASPPVTEADYQEAIQYHYAWADLDGDPYEYIIPTLSYYNDVDAMWIEVPADYAFNVNNIIVSYDLTSRIVKANFYADGQTPQLDIQVAVFISNISQGTEGTIIDLCGLNLPGNTDSTYDRRLVNRTKAWFTVLSTMKPFTLIDFSGPQGMVLFNMLWNSVLITAASTGFFSVWYIILRRLSDPSGANLGKRFINESKHANLFPGTNTNTLG